MSDIEEYFTDGSDNEDNESSDNDDKIKIIKKTNENTIENILDNSDEDDEDDEDEDEEIKNKDPDDYYDEDEEQIGGANSDEESDDDDDDDQSENEDISSNIKTTYANKGKKTAKITIDPVLDEDEIEDDDEEEDENYLQKFDNEISKNYISEQHPECAIHNYDEIAKLTIIVKDNDGIIIDPLHKTLPFLTKYEKTRVLGQRTKQIECGATPFIKVPEGIIDAHIIAELELQQKRIPVIIRRPLPGGGSEYWNLKDLEMILF